MKLVRRCLVVATFAVVILQAGSALAATVLPQSVLAVSFSDSQKGYLAGGYTSANGVLAYTSNGGVTWSPTQFPGRRAWAVGASFDGSSATAAADYYDEEILTTNSGGTWSSDTPVFGGVPSFGGTSHITDIAYLSGGRIAVGQQEGTALNGNIGVIARETGGVWAPDFRPLYYPIGEDPAQLTYAALASIDATAGGDVAWAVGAEYSDAQRGTVTRSLIYRTANGGSTWTTDTATSAAMTADLSAVTAANSSVAYAIARSSGTGLGSRYPYHRSAAGVWTRMDQIAALNSIYPNALDAYDADHLVVVGDSGKVYYTANATNATPTWVARPTTGSTNHLYGVQMTGPDSWIAVGGGETIVRFTNGGTTQSGSIAPTNPTLAITSPTQGFPLPFAGSITGTAADTGVGVAKVEVRIQRENNTFWNGSTWVADSNQWNLATGTTSWTYPFIPSGSPTALTIAVRATDGMNLQVTSTITATGGGPIDGTPPVTTSNAQASYPLTGGTITLTPTDPGGSGVEFTYWRIGDSAAWTQGTSVPVPTTAASYTLYFYSVDIAGNPESPAKSVTFQVSAAVPKNVYRFRNLQNGFYLWSADETEKAFIIANLSQTWDYEGVAYTRNTLTNTAPLWRFRNLAGGFYLYSADPGEKDTIVATLSSEWQLEGEAYKVSRNPSGRPVWRFRNKQDGTYLLSADPNEKDTIVATLSATWELEGPAFYLAQ